MIESDFFVLAILADLWLVHTYLLGFSHTKLMTKLQPMYDPKFCESYLNRRNSARLVLEVVDDRNSKIGRGKVFEHVRRQSHQANEQVTTDV